MQGPLVYLASSLLRDAPGGRFMPGGRSVPRDPCLESFAIFLRSVCISLLRTSAYNATPVNFADMFISRLYTLSCRRASFSPFLSRLESIKTQCFP